MKKQIYLIMFALVAFIVAFALSSCNTPNPAEESGGNGRDSTLVQNPDQGSDSKEENTLPAGALSGLFSVNADGKQVRFSQGNLQYTQSTDTWSFAKQQYEILGEKNLTGATLHYDGSDGQDWSGSGLADKIDLFGWSGSTGGAKWGVSISKEAYDYSGDFVDWGENPIKNGGNKFNQWHTLTYDEWYYLLSERRNSDELIGVAQVMGVNGLILLPDNFTLPTGLSFKSGFADTYSAYAYASYQSYTQHEWSRMESAGAVFLPASGFRHCAYIDYLGYSNYYWSGTPYDESYAGNLDFDSHKAYMNGGHRSYGHSVRLVQDMH